MHPGEIGAAVRGVLEGTRPILLESRRSSRPPILRCSPRRHRRRPERLAMIVAVLARTPACARRRRRVRERCPPGASGSTNRAPISASPSRLPRQGRACPVREGLAAFGEIGLTGPPAGATQADRRVEECRKLGPATVLAPIARKGAGVGRRRCAAASPPVSARKSS